MDRGESTGQEPFRHGRQVYVRAPRPILFPSEERLDERAPLTKLHQQVRTTLFLSLEEAPLGAAVGSRQFVYLNAAEPRKRLAPDLFVKLGAKNDSFETWKVWERGAPDLAVEIVSDSDRSESDWGEKLARYQASGIGEVVRFDADNEVQPIQVWDRVQGELVERVASGAASRECVALGLWWVVVPSDDGPQLRLSRDRDGKSLLPTPNEERLQLAEALAEERKARGAAEHARNLAEHARNLAEHTLREEREAHERATAAAAAEAAVAAEAAAAEIERLRAEVARLRG